MKPLLILPLTFALLNATPALAVLDATKPMIIETHESISLKKKIAIARFTNETRSASAFLLDEKNDRVGKQAADILSSRLAATGKFLMFERQDKNYVDVETALKGIKESGVSVDYIIVGSVSEFGRSTESDTGMFQRAKTQRAYAKVNVRLIETSTGRIVSSVEGKGEATTSTKNTFGSGSSAAYDQSLTDKALSSAISQMITNISTEMTTSPWRSYILSNDGGSYIIAGGDAQGLKAGMDLGVFKKGKLVKNPQTGATIELPSKEIATLNIDMTHGDDEWNQISFTSLVNGSINGDLTQYYVGEK